MSDRWDVKEAEVRQGITPTDLAVIREILTKSSLAKLDHALRYNPTLDRWELYVTKDLGILVAHNTDGEWTEV